jgi:hypothetical protein
MIQIEPEELERIRNYDPLADLSKRSRCASKDQTSPSDLRSTWEIPRPSY